jgi:hypothetical protein
MSVSAPQPLNDREVAYDFIRQSVGGVGSTYWRQASQQASRWQDFLRLAARRPPGKSFGSTAERPIEEGGVS